MAKFSGLIGFSSGIMNNEGICEYGIEEKMYHGDLNKIYRRSQSTESANDDITLANEISIIADPFINENLYNIKYVTFMGVKWKITNVTVQEHRMILTLGGIYHG